MPTNWCQLNWSPWRSFVAKEVKAHAPDVAGVYLLRAGPDPASPLVYVGTATSIARRLREHQHTGFSNLKRRESTIEKSELEYSYATVEPTKGDLRLLEARIIDEHRQELGLLPLLNLVSPITGPIFGGNVGLLGPDGKPLANAAKATIFRDVGFVRRDLMEWISKEPERLYQIGPRVFEEVIAEVFHKLGYEVTLTPQTRDGGKDIYAVKSDTLVKFLCIVECKRFAPDNPVDVEIVRALYGVQQAERVPLSVIATTSRFTLDAEKFHKSFESQMMLRDFKKVTAWIDEYLKS